MNRRRALSRLTAVVLIAVAVLLIAQPWDRGQESTFRIVGNVFARD